MPEIVLVALAGTVLAQIAPGPNLLAVAGAALGQGRRAALFTVAGVAAAIFVWVALFAFGLGAVLALYPSLLTVMKLAGGAYLLVLGLKGLRAAWAGRAPSLKASDARRSDGQAFARGFLVNITNPKSALMWVAVTTLLFGGGLSAWGVLAFAPLGAGSALTVYGTYAALFSSGLARRVHARFARAIEALFGAAFGLIGGRLFVDGVREAAARLR